MTIGLPPVREMPDPNDRPCEWTVPEKEIIFMELRSIREAVVEIAERMAILSEKEKLASPGGVEGKG